MNVQNNYAVYTVQKVVSVLSNDVTIGEGRFV